jgi:hypothetical protein
VRLGEKRYRREGRPVRAWGKTVPRMQRSAKCCASVPVLTFVSHRGEFAYECQNQKDTSKYEF